jgi:hypothetical protein
MAICCVQSGNETGVCQEYCGLPCQYHSTSATDWYCIILPSALLSLRNWQPLSFVTTEGQQNKTVITAVAITTMTMAVPTNRHQNIALSASATYAPLNSTRDALCTSHACLQYDKLWCKPERIHMWCNHVFWTLNWLPIAWPINLSHFI